MAAGLRAPLRLPGQPGQSPWGSGLSPAHMRFETVSSPCTAQLCWRSPVTAHAGHVVALGITGSRLLCPSSGQERTRDQTSTGAERPLSGPRVGEEGRAETCGPCSESRRVQPEHPGNSGETPLKGCTARKAHKTAGWAASDYSNNLIKRNCLLGHGGWEGN